jgi:hypothetical protein
MYNLTSAGGVNIFISKLDASGNFIWAKSMGGLLDSYANFIAVDGFGNVYTTGAFYGMADFDPGTGTYNLTSLGNTDIFLSKLDSSGNFIWAKRTGSTQQDQGNCIIADTLGNIYISGFFTGIVDFDPGAGIVNLSSAGSADIFILKLNTSGNFIWARNLGGSSVDESSSLTSDPFGNIYITGDFQAIADFDPAPGIYNLTSSLPGMAM